MNLPHHPESGASWGLAWPNFSLGLLQAQHLGSPTPVASSVIFRWHWSSKHSSASPNTPFNCSSVWTNTLGCTFCVLPWLASHWTLALCIFLRCPSRHALGSIIWSALRARAVLELGLGSCLLLIVSESLVPFCAS